MERNIGDQLNKAFEAYRQVSIEKDNAKKELQKMVTTQAEQLSAKRARFCHCSANDMPKSSLASPAFHESLKSLKMCLLLCLVFACVCGFTGGRKIT